MPLIVPGIAPASKDNDDKKNNDNSKKTKAKFEHHQANPGPVIPENTDVFTKFETQQGTKKEEDRK